VQLQYGDQTVETSMNKFVWRESFTFGLWKEHTELEVRVIEKGGIFRPDSQIGEGSINLLEAHNVKCILGTTEKKVAILYFKLALQ
jgi:hypothetical protein